jgi:hypothetical protein
VKIREAMQHSWAGYKKGAWGADEVLPRTGGRKDVWGGEGVCVNPTVYCGSNVGVCFGVRHGDDDSGCVRHVVDHGHGG